MIDFGEAGVNFYSILVSSGPSIVLSVDTHGDLALF